MNDVAKLVKEYLNMDDNLVIVGCHGYELMDNKAIRGESKRSLRDSKMLSHKLVTYSLFKAQKGQINEHSYCHTSFDSLSF